MATLREKSLRAVFPRNHRGIRRKNRLKVRESSSLNFDPALISWGRDCPSTGTPEREYGAEGRGGRGNLTLKKGTYRQDRGA